MIFRFRSKWSRLLAAVMVVVGNALAPLNLNCCCVQAALLDIACDNCQVVPAASATEDCGACSPGAGMGNTSFSEAPQRISTSCCGSACSSQRSPAVANQADIIGSLSANSDCNPKDCKPKDCKPNEGTEVSTDSGVNRCTLAAGNCECCKSQVFDILRANRDSDQPRNPMFAAASWVCDGYRLTAGGRLSDQPARTVWHSASALRAILCVWHC